MVNFSKEFQSIAALRTQEKGGNLVGVISQLRIGDHVLAPDIEIQDPAGGDGRILVVALLIALEWNLCADGKIIIRGFLSEANGQPTQLVYYTSQEPFEVEIQLAIYAHDGVAQKKYRQFFTGSSALCTKVAKATEDESNNELCFFVELFECASPAITHTGAEATNKLGDGVAEGALEWYAAFDAFGNHCGSGFFDGEVAVGRALFHCSDAAHSAIDFVSAVAINFHFTR